MPRAITPEAAAEIERLIPVLEGGGPRYAGIVERARRAVRIGREPSITPEAARAAEGGLSPEQRRRARALKLALMAGGATEGVAARRGLASARPPEWGPEEPTRRFLAEGLEPESGGFRRFIEAPLGAPEEPTSAGAVARNIPRVIASIPGTIGTAPARVVEAGIKAEALDEPWYAGAPLQAAREAGALVPGFAEAHAAYEAPEGFGGEAALEQFARGGGLTAAMPLLYARGRGGPAKRPRVEVLPPEFPRLPPGQRMLPPGPPPPPRVFTMEPEPFEGPAPSFYRAPEPRRGVPPSPPPDLFLAPRAAPPAPAPTSYVPPPGARYAPGVYPMDPATMGSLAEAVRGAGREIPSPAPEGFGLMRNPAAALERMEGRARFAYEPEPSIRPGTPETTARFRHIEEAHPEVRGAPPPEGAEAIFRVLPPRLRTPEIASLSVEAAEYFRAGSLPPPTVATRWLDEIRRIPGVREWEAREAVDNIWRLLGIPLRERPGIASAPVVAEAARARGAARPRRPRVDLPQEAPAAQPEPSAVAARFGSLEVGPLRAGAAPSSLEGVFGPQPRTPAAPAPPMPELPRPPTTRARPARPSAEETGGYKPGTREADDFRIGVRFGLQGAVLPEFPAPSPVMRRGYEVGMARRARPPREAPAAAPEPPPAPTIRPPPLAPTQMAPSPSLEDVFGPTRRMPAVPRAAAPELPRPPTSRARRPAPAVPPPQVAPPAPPGRSFWVGRGAKGSVRVVFPSALEADLWAIRGRQQRAHMASGRVSDPKLVDPNPAGIGANLAMDAGAAEEASIAYRARVKVLTDAAPADATIEAPPFEAAGATGRPAPAPERPVGVPEAAPPRPATVAEEARALVEEGRGAARAGEPTPAGPRPGPSEGPPDIIDLHGGFPVWTAVKGLISAAKRTEVVKAAARAFDRAKFLEQEGLKDLAEHFRRAEPLIAGAEADGLVALARVRAGWDRMTPARREAMSEAMLGMSDLSKSDPAAFRQQYAQWAKDADFKRVDEARRWLYGWLERERRAAFPGAAEIPYYVPKAVRLGEAPIPVGPGAVSPRAAAAARVRMARHLRERRGGGDWEPDIFTQFEADARSKVVQAREHVLIRESLKTGTQLRPGQRPPPGTKIVELTPREVSIAEALGMLDRAAVAHQPRAWGVNYRWAVRPPVEMALRELRPRVSALAPMWHGVEKVATTFARFGVSLDLAGMGINWTQAGLAGGSPRPIGTRIAIARSFLRGAVNAAGSSRWPAVRAVLEDTAIQRWARLKPDEMDLLVRMSEAIGTEIGGRTPVEIQATIPRVPGAGVPSRIANAPLELVDLWLRIADKVQYAPEGVQQILKVEMFRALTDRPLLRRAVAARLLSARGRAAVESGIRPVEKALGLETFDPANPASLKALGEELKAVAWDTALKGADPGVRGALRVLVRFPSARAAHIRSAINVIGRRPGAILRMALVSDILNMLMTEDSHHVWENDPENLGRIETWIKDENGQPYAIPAFGPIGIAFRALGLPGMMKRAWGTDIGGGEQFEMWLKSLPKNMVRELTYALTPIFGAAWVVVAGHDPATGRPVASRAREIAAQMVPPLEPLLTARPSESAGMLAARAAASLMGAPTARLYGGAPYGEAVGAAEERERTDVERFVRGWATMEEINEDRMERGVPPLSPKRLVGATLPTRIRELRGAAREPERLRFLPPPSSGR